MITALELGVILLLSSIGNKTFKISIYFASFSDEAWGYQKLSENLIEIHSEEYFIF